MNAGPEVFKILAWKQSTHTLALVWQSLWIEAEKGKFGDVQLADQLDLKSETYLTLLGSLVRLGLIRVFRDAQDRRKIAQISVLPELDSPTRERLLLFRTTGQLPQVLRNNTDQNRDNSDAGVFFDFSLHNELIDNTKLITQENTKLLTQENTQLKSKSITLEKGVGKTFSAFPDLTLNDLVDQIAAGIVQRAQVKPRKPKKATEPTPEESQQIQDLFRLWLQIMGYQDRGLTLADFRVKHALARLRAGHLLSEFVEIMEWCATDDHMMGRKDGRPYNDFDTLFASDAKFEKYLKIARTRRAKAAPRTSENLLASDKPTTFTRL